MLRSRCRMCAACSFMLHHSAQDPSSIIDAINTSNVQHAEHTACWTFFVVPVGCVQHVHSCCIILPRSHNPLLTRSTYQTSNMRNTPRVGRFLMRNVEARHFKRTVCYASQIFCLLWLAKMERSLSRRNNRGMTRFTHPTSTLHPHHLVSRCINFFGNVTIFEFAGRNHLLILAVPTHHLTRTPAFVGHIDGHYACQA